jgi:hypothetical protein
MLEINRYPLNYYRERTISLPYGFQVMNVIHNDDGPMLYILHEADFTIAQGLHAVRIFYVVDGSSQPLPDCTAYIGTICRADGMVWHYFYEIME